MRHRVHRCPKPNYFDFSYLTIIKSHEMRARKNKPNISTAFAIKDCALIALATGKKARILQEFRNELASIDISCIYHHFWGGLLHPRFEEREYNNDLAAWVQHGIHDIVLAERLSALTPTNFSTLESLRQEILEIIDVRIDEVEALYWTRATRPFDFVRSQIVVFNTLQTFDQVSQLAEQISNLSSGSIFYHFIDARRRTPDGRDDFSVWLDNFGNQYASLQTALSGIDPYFGSLVELRDALGNAFILHAKNNPS